MKKTEILCRMVDPGVIAVIRADSSEQLVSLCGALADGGITCMEITMTTPGALEAITAASKAHGDRIVMGVGSVLDDITARLAFLAGAQFVVTPVMCPAVITMCRRYSKPIVCGAYTPTEAMAAHEAGADFVKIFPADKLGADYIKAIRGPMPQLELIPTGGVDAKTAGDFIKAGCPAVAAGSNLAPKAAIAKGDWSSIQALASELVAAVRKAKVAN
jgi:2-dehydro-3-deoxyphosphogluconate aldolase / (4S)-4-hydroxy-2-oxoglutarate aldolase